MVQPHPVVLIFLLVYVSQTLFQLWLENRNRVYLKEQGNRIPEPFRDVIDAQTLRKSRAYALEHTRMDMVSTAVSDLVLLALILSGLLPLVQRLTIAWDLSVIPAGLVFFLVPGIVSYAADLPFEYHETFRIEEKYGFNRYTRKLWIVDQLKSVLITGALMALVLCLVLWAIERFPKSWWLWGFLVVSAVQIVLLELYPVLIAPLFNKFELVTDRTLAEKIRALLERTGIRVGAVLQMDAGKRSSHSNAYFTGLGRTKRVVLFDTLIRSHSHDELLAVLAHEAGHHIRKHVLKQLGLALGATLLGFYIAYRAMQWPRLCLVFGFDAPASYAGLFLIAVFGGKAAFFLRPLFMGLSRRYERQADAFAASMPEGRKPLADALKRLASDNLANLTPHPMYVLFHYGHPPLVERVQSIEKGAESTRGGSVVASLH